MLIRFRAFGVSTIIASLGMSVYGVCKHDAAIVLFPLSMIIAALLLVAPMVSTWKTSNDFAEL